MKTCERATDGTMACQCSDVREDASSCCCRGRATKMVDYKYVRACDREAADRGANVQQYALVRPECARDLDSERDFGAANN